MLKRKVDGEPEEFAGLRDCIWRLCEIGEKNRKKEDFFPRLRENLPYYCVECNARGVVDNKKEEETMMTKEEELKQVTVRMPFQLWMEFKILCLQKKKNIGDYMIEVITKEINENKKKEATDKDDEIKLF